MVAKPALMPFGRGLRLNLAKIHMVAKHSERRQTLMKSLNLAKIHMVAKLLKNGLKPRFCLNLAKIHMVAKPIESC